MLRIDIRQGPRDGVRVRLSGQLTGPWVEELRAACGPLRSSLPAVALDLSELGFADLLGRGLLRDLRREGFRLERLSPFLAAQLEGEDAHHL